MWGSPSLPEWTCQPQMSKPIHAGVRQVLPRYRTAMTPSGATAAAATFTHVEVWRAPRSNEGM